MKTCLLTGATGMVGNFLVARAIAEGRPLAVLVRDKGSLKAQDRLPDGVRVITGDLTRPDLGIASEDLNWIMRNCDHVLHAGANVTFLVQARTGEPYRTNIDGTRYVLNLCRDLNLEHLTYVSTAYVCGDRTGIIQEEELECGQAFNNDYERSKFAAESLVRQATFLRTKSIFRPSVVMGDSASGYTPSYHSVYNLIQLAWLGRSLPLSQLLETAKVDPQTTVNLIPGDWVAEAIWNQIPHRETLATYHLTHPTPVSVGELLETVYSLKNKKNSKSLVLAPDNAAKVLDPLRGYIRQHPDFKSSVSPVPPKMDRALLTRLSQYAVDNNFLPVRPTILVTNLLSELVTSEALSQLTLEFSQGQKTHFNFGQERPRTSSSGQSENTAFVREDVFNHLLNGELSLKSAMEQGALVLESEDLEITLGHLKSLLLHLGGAAS